MAVLNEHDLEETFVRGSGPGGQKINKSMNKVRLRHIPTGLTVACQEQRDLTTNRSFARKILREKVDHLLNGVESRVGRRITKIQRNKSKAAR
jgi:protein subunit release factor B